MFVVSLNCYHKLWAYDSMSLGTHNVQFPSFAAWLSLHLSQYSAKICDGFINLISVSHLDPLQDLIVKDDMI
jgi:hypothetical protein